MLLKFSTPYTRDKLKALKNSLLKLNQNSNEYENPYEKQINTYINSIDSILDFIDPKKDNLGEAKRFMEVCLHEIEENDDRYERIKDWIPTVL
jgi:hypothetical protein